MIVLFFYYSTYAKDRDDFILQIDLATLYTFLFICNSCPNIACIVKMSFLTIGQSYDKNYGHL